MDAMKDISETVAQRTTWLSASLARAREAAHLKGAVLPAHAHERTAIVLILSGSVAETSWGTTAAHGPGVVRLLGAGATHSTQIRGRGRYLVVELLDSELCFRLARTGPAARNEPLALASPAVLVRQMYEEFLIHDTVSPLALDGLVLQFVAALSRGGQFNVRRGRRPPEWLVRARDRLDAEFCQPPTLAVLARDAGVHPVTLSRAFRRWFASTIPSYVNFLRIGSAKSALASTHESVTAVALAAGFCDASQFARRFRALTGTTPTAYRALHQADGVVSCHEYVDPGELTAHHTR